jgi:hypothetical protein
MDSDIVTGSGQTMTQLVTPAPTGSAAVPVSLSIGAVSTYHMVVLKFTCPVVDDFVGSIYLSVGSPLNRRLACWHPCCCWSRNWRLVPVPGGETTAGTGLPVAVGSLALEVRLLVPKTSLPLHH